MRNEQLCQTLDIGNMFGQLFLQNIIVIPIQGIKLPKNCNPHDSYLLIQEFAPPYVSPNLAQNLLSDQLWAPLL
jgi:hypothetical protein